MPGSKTRYTDTMHRALFAAGVLTAIGTTLALPAGTETRRDMTSYEARADLGTIHVGVDLLGHNVPVRDQSFGAPDYIVLEVAFVSDNRQSIVLHDTEFSLIVN